MEYNQNTKISDIIGHNKDSIQAIAAIAPPLIRLKNPILRKIMASRVTIEEAAKMGGCEVSDFIRVLQPLGYQYSPEDEDKGSDLHGYLPGWLVNAASSAVHTFDVRPIIDNGTDPLQAIISEFKKIEPGEILCIINTFVPTPLIHLLEKKQAEQSYSKKVSESEFHTYFLKKIKPSATSPPKSNVIMDNESEFGAACDRFSPDQRKEIDVRNLEMPLPMQTILMELDQLSETKALYIHHKRVPVYLLEELADGKFEVHIHHIAEGNVKMLIFYKKMES